MGFHIRLYQSDLHHTAHENIFMYIQEVKYIFYLVIFYNIHNRVDSTNNKVLEN